MEVDGVRPSSFHSHSGCTDKAHSSGSLLAAVLARSWGQSARHAGPALGSLFLFPGPIPRLGASRSWVGRTPTDARAQKRSRSPGLIPT